MAGTADDSWRRAGDAETVNRAVVGNDDAWTLTFGVNNHLVLLTATALSVIYVAASLMLFVWRWRGCLVRIVTLFIHFIMPRP